MKNTLLTLALTATLIAPAMGNQAIAGSAVDRQVENDYRWNGITLNGIRLNGNRSVGVFVNGIQPNGVFYNGIALQGSRGSDTVRLEPQNPFAGLDTAPLGQ